MSAKWQRSKRWDDEFFPGWAWPAKALLRAFSSIPLAVVLLTFVLVYGMFASVPIGLLALIPTWAVICATLVLMVGAVTVPVVMIARRAVSKRERGVRFMVTFLAAVTAATLSALAWWTFVWPALRYDPSTGEGLRLFAAFVRSYESTTLRRLPAFEMTEGEFYAWWPLRIVLILFVINMTMATVRRIEFKFVNIGVLTVHSGIVLLTLGSIHYQNLKQEGDVLLLAGPTPSVPGPTVTSFMDRSKPALWARLNGRPWSAMPIDGLPRYNDYGDGLSQRELSLELPAIPPGEGGEPIDLRIVGFGSYVEFQEGWTPRDQAPESGTPQPILDLDVLSSIDESNEDEPPRTVAHLRIPAGDPAERVVNVGGALQIEHVPPDDRRWSWLGATIDTTIPFALATKNNDGAYVATAVTPGSIVVANGFKASVRSIHPTPPFPIITPGYEGATSSVAILDVESPNGESFERWVFHRYPELNQDIWGSRDDGRPDRRPADPNLDIALIDANSLHVFVRGDEAIVRAPGGAVSRFDELAMGDLIPLAPKVSLRVTERWPHAERIVRPFIVPPTERQRDFIGTHDRAAIAVELAGGGAWSQVVWLPFGRFMNVAMGNERTIELPDGRTLRLAFSRAPRSLPGIGLQLVDFEMIPYPHSDIPRDYVSEVRVRDLSREDSATHITRLNRPLIHRAPFHWDDERPMVANALTAAVQVIAPNRYKFSQAGWDAEGWRETAAQVETGELDRPRASFTILGVGNNPGIHIIAIGGVMICVGTPWAFYVKPWLLRRKRDQLKREHAARLVETRPSPQTPESAQVLMESPS